MTSSKGTKQHIYGVEQKGLSHKVKFIDIHMQMELL
jgi:hypothetical protein